MTGEALQEGEERQAAKARSALLAGAFVFLASGGLVLIGLATRHTALNQEQSEDLISVGVGEEVVCGTLVSGVGELESKTTTDAGSLVTIGVPFAEVSELTLVAECPGP